MNCVQLTLDHVAESPHRPAIWLPGASAGSLTTFAELYTLANTMQHALVTAGVQSGDLILVQDRLSVRLYAAVFAILGLGATVVLIEPWMPARDIESATRAVSPKFSVSGWLGKLWGLRYRAIRSIPHKLNIRALAQPVNGWKFVVEDTDADSPAIITFTSGTTGAPKGVVRTQGALLQQHQVLSRSLKTAELTGPDLCIFANFVLSNLASGRPSLLLPNPWQPRLLRQIDQLPPALQPDSLTCGPAFLSHLTQHATLPSLKSVHVGGALTDCRIFERAFERWPHAHWKHLYGSTEAEPVAVADAQTAVSLSREKGYFQTLFLGNSVPEIAYRSDQRGLWVHGPHVCGPYLGNEEANRTDKHTDEAGRAWHFMGDRIATRERDDAWWYRGRANQPEPDFELEQTVYTALQSSNCFVHRTPSGEALLVGEIDPNIQLPGIDRIVRTRIVRDRRHRSRIDRHRSLTRGAKWAFG